MRQALAVAAMILAVAPAFAEPLYVGSDEHFSASVGIVLNRGDINRWAAKDDSIQAYCFFHAANIAHVDGRWYAINGISRDGLRNHWMQVDGRREFIEDGDKELDPLRAFLYDLNEKMNDSCP